MPASIGAVTLRLSLATLAVTIAFAAMSQPSAAQGDAKPAADAAKIAKGKEVFDNYACGSCHSLNDAGAAGHVGPSLDGDSNLSEAFVVDRVTKGQGGMPAFSGQLSQDEIAALASYVMHASSK